MYGQTLDNTFNYIQTDRREQSYIKSCLDFNGYIRIFVVDCTQNTSN